MSSSRALQADNTIGGRWLSPLRDHWSSALCRTLARETAAVRVVIAATRGSSPREAGACMLVMHDGLEGTIGGGHLEWAAVREARALLSDTNAGAARVKRMVLGQDLAQCCGGEVHLWLERYTRRELTLLRKISTIAARRNIAAAVLATSLSGTTCSHRLLDAKAGQAAERDIVLIGDREDEITLMERIEFRQRPLCLYGAGHVAQALIRILGELPFAVTWIDSREQLLPSDVPENVRTMQTDAPIELIRHASSQVHHVVMTHDHGLDYVLCREILMRNEFATLGLIGSKSKAARFRSQLKRDGVSPERIARLICPIGVQGIESKLPAAIAVGIAAQLLQQIAVPVSTASETDAGSCADRTCANCLTTGARE